MPKATRSSRLDSTKHKEKSPEQTADLSSHNSTNTATNSKPDLDVHDYKLHFELTDLETTNSTTDVEQRQQPIGPGPEGDRDSLKDERQEEPPHSPTRLEHSERAIGADKDGIGEPDYTYDSSNLNASSYDPALIEDRQQSSIRSSPQVDSSHQHHHPQNQLDGSSHFFPTSHSQHSNTMQNNYDIHANGSGGSSNNAGPSFPHHPPSTQHAQQTPQHSAPQHPQHHSPMHQQHMHLHPAHHSQQHQTPPHHQQHSGAPSHHPHAHHISPSHGSVSHTPGSHHTPMTNHTPHSNPYSTPHHPSSGHAGPSHMHGSHPGSHPGMYHTPHPSHGPSPYPSPYPQHGGHGYPPPVQQQALRLGEYLHGLSRHVHPAPPGSQSGQQPFAFGDEHVALFKKETQQTNSKRHTEDRGRREWLANRLNLMPEVAARAMINTGNTETFNMIARLPFPNDRPVNMLSDMEIYNGNIRVLGAEFPHDGELDWYRAVFIPYDAQLYITRRPAVARCNGRIVVKQPQTLKGGRCRVFVVGFFDPMTQRWEYSTKFAVYGTRFLVKERNPKKLSPEVMRK